MGRWALGRVIALVHACAPALVWGVILPWGFTGASSAAASDGIRIHLAGKDKIWTTTLDPGDASFSPLRVAAESGAVALARSPDGRWLAATSRRANSEAEAPDGMVTLYRVDRETGECRTAGTQATEGRTACFVSFDRTSRHLFVANFRQSTRDSRGSVVRLPIFGSPAAGASLSSNRIGSLGAVDWRGEHAGSGPMRPRQAASHPHSVVVSPDNRLVVVGDLGIDRAVAYRFDADTGDMDRVGDSGFRSEAGSGPRHVAFHPTGKYLFVIHENTGRIDSFSTGESTFGRRVGTAPPRGGASADLEMHPSGKWLFGSNRKGDSVMVVAVDEETGDLTHVQLVEGLGSGPRELEVTPNGRFLLVSNTGSQELVALRVDERAGRLRETGQTVRVEGLRAAASWLPKKSPRHK